jgi:hypothetical protein
MAHLDGRPVDHLPLMPITMMFACDQIGAHYRDYCTDYRVLVEGRHELRKTLGSIMSIRCPTWPGKWPIAARLSD